MRASSILVVASVVVCLAGSAWAELIPCCASGTVSEVTVVKPSEFDLDGSVHVGSPITFAWEYDTTASDGNSDPTVGQYGLFHFQVDVGNYTFEGQGPSLEIRDDYNATTMYDEYRVKSGTVAVTHGQLEGSEGLNGPMSDFCVDLYDSSATALPSDAQCVPPDLPAWTSHSASVTLYSDGGSCISITASLDSVTPEPTATVLLAMGGLTVLIRRRK